MMGAPMVRVIRLVRVLTYDGILASIKWLFGIFTADYAHNLMAIIVRCMAIECPIVVRMKVMRA